MIAKLRTVGIVVAALLLAMLFGILVARAAGADGPWLWQEKFQCGKLKACKVVVSR